jgi:hypothetical protein
MSESIQLLARVEQAVPRCGRALRTRQSAILPVTRRGRRIAAGRNRHGASIGIRGRVPTRAPGAVTSVYQRWQYTHGTEAPLVRYAPAAVADIAEAAAQLRRAFRALGVSAPPTPMETCVDGRRSVRPPPPSMAEASAAAFNRRHPQLAEALAGRAKCHRGSGRRPRAESPAGATEDGGGVRGHLRAAPGAPAPPAGSRGVGPEEARGTEQVPYDADTLEPLVGVPPATEARAPPCVGAPCEWQPR